MSKKHDTGRPDVLPHTYVQAKMDKERMDAFNDDLAKLKSKSLSMVPLERVLKSCDLRFTRGTFKTKEGKEHKQIYLGHFHLERGEFVDGPEEGAFAPPHHHYVLPFGVALWVPVHPKDMVKKKDPLESVLFPRPGMDGYDEALNGRLEKMMSLLEEYINEKRMIYLAENEDEFHLFPTTKYKSAEHLREKLLDALWDESKLAEGRKLTYMSHGILNRDEKRNYADKPDLRPARDQVEQMALFEKYYMENLDCKDRAAQLLALAEIREKWESSFTLPKNPDHLPEIRQLKFMKHFDRTGKEISRYQIAKYLRGKECIVAPIVHVKPMTSKPTFHGGARSRNHKEDGTKTQFLHNTLPVGLYGLYWLANGKSSTGMVDPTADIELRRFDDEAEFVEGEEEDDDDKEETNERKHERDESEPAVGNETETETKRPKSEEEDGDDGDDEPPSTQVDIVNTEDTDKDAE